MINFELSLCLAQELIVSNSVKQYIALEAVCMLCHVSNKPGCDRGVSSAGSFNGGVCRVLMDARHPSAGRGQSAPYWPGQLSECVLPTCKGLNR